jgi:hypothetical protein
VNRFSGPLLSALMTRHLHVAAMLLHGLIVSAAVHAQSSGRDDGMRFVPDVPGQFISLTRNPEALGLNVGGSPDPSMCRHYQAIVRVDGADGTPFFLMTRSGNTPPFPGEPGCDDSDGETRNGHLIVFRMGSRDMNGERLRGNRYKEGVHISKTQPLLDDKATIYFTVVENGLVPFDGGDTVPPKVYQHPGGMQLVGNILGIALETPRLSALPDQLPDDNYDKALNRTLISFFDVSDPEAPRFKSNFVPINGAGEVLANAGALGITPLANGRYLMVVAGGPGTTFFFYRSTLTDLGSETLDWDYVGSTPGPDVEDAHQTLHFLREGNIDGPLYLAGARGVSYLNNHNRIDLYKVECATPAACHPGEAIELPVRYNGKEIQPVLPTGGGNELADLSAASGFHVTPSGELLFYATEHDNDGPNDSVKAGEWRHQDVVRDGSPTLLPTAAINGPYDVDEGSSVVLSGTGAPPITRPWIQFFHDPNFSASSFNWIVDSDDYYRDDFDNFAALEPWVLEHQVPILHNDKASSLKWFAPVGCSMRVIDYEGVGNVAEARTLQGTGAVVRMPNLASVLNDGGTDDIDDELDTVEFLSNCTSYYSSPVALSWDLDSDGTYESPGDAATLSAARLDGPSELNVSAQAQHPFGGSPGVAATTVRVHNVAPQIIGFALTNTSRQRLGIDVPFALVGLPVAVGATFADPGLPDRQTATIEWSDGTTDQQTTFTVFDEAFGDGAGTLGHAHRYALPGEYEIKVSVADDDRGEDVRTAMVRIVTPEQAVMEIIALLDALIASTTDAKTRADLLQARDALAGKNDYSNNGALNMIRSGNFESAIAMLGITVNWLNKASASGADTTTVTALVQQVAAAL